MFTLGDKYCIISQCSHKIICLIDEEHSISHHLKCFCWTLTKDNIDSTWPLLSQMMAVQDRVNVEDLSVERPLADLAALPNSHFLPSSEDNYSMRCDFIQVISLILIKHLKAFKCFEGLVSEHFVHRYSDIMKQKSVVVRFPFQHEDTFFLTPCLPNYCSIIGLQ